MTRLSAGGGALADATFRALWLSRLVSAIGSAVIPVAMAFAVLEIGGGVGQLGTVLACGAVTEVVMLTVGGVWADRLPRRTVMLSTEAFSGLLAGGLGLLLLTGHAQVWHFGALAMASAVGKAFFRPATAGLVSELVPPRQLQSANALLSLCRSVPAVAGPAVAGLLVALAGPGWAYVIDGASFLFSALLLATIPVGRREPKERDSFWSELRGGAAEVTGRPWLWQNLLSHGLWNLGFSMLFVLGPTLVMVETSGSAAGTGAAGWAAVSTGLTVGGLAGGLLALRISCRRPLVVANLALATGAAPFLAMLADAPIWTVVVAAAVAAAGTDVLGALWDSTVQQLVPQEKMSRVTAYDWMVSLSITPLGYALAGPLAEHLGFTRALLVPVLLILLPSITLAFLPAIRSIERSADGTVTQHPVAPDQSLEYQTTTPGR
ncbi:MFS transporter [Kitasatospora gansuensis]